MWTRLKTKAITALTISALALGAAAPANAMDDQTRNLIKGAAAVVIIGALLHGMTNDRPAPQQRYAPPPQPQRFAQSPQHHRMAPPPQGQRMAPSLQGQRMAPPPRPGRLVGAGNAPLRDYAERNGGPRGYDLPRLDQPPRPQPMR